ncbi:hypothetical protein EDB84DRAFT_1674996 [Lactarius hengduanensis]|nr:hypothetical protein EDB84DRAFT_1674996 [Lactarius hengduanensis]
MLSHPPLQTVFLGALHASHTLSLPHKHRSQYTRTRPSPALHGSPTNLSRPLRHTTNPSMLHSQRRLASTRETNPLAVLYNGILSFVERDVKRIMDIAERISARIEQRTDVVDNEASVKKLPMCTLFAAGPPEEFRRVRTFAPTTGSESNAQLANAELRNDAGVYPPSVRAIRVMVAYPKFLSFEQRWQLPAPLAKLDYFAVATADVEHENGKENSSPSWHTAFGKLMLQIIISYDWGDTKKTFHVHGRLPRPRVTPQSQPADDGLLRQCAAVITDAKLLHSQTWVLWRDEVSPMLAPVFIGEEAPTEHGQAEGMSLSAPRIYANFQWVDALRSTLQGLSALIPPLSSQIVSILTRRASGALQPVRSMPLQFRAMSNKRPPSEPSFFVVGVLRPVRAFFGMESGTGPGASLKDELMQSFVEEVFEAVVEKYIIYATAMPKKESLRKLKKGKDKTPFSLFRGGPKEEDGRDEERVRQQMVLDVEGLKDLGKTRRHWRGCPRKRDLQIFARNGDHPPE